MSSNDKQIISKSNASVGSGCCGGGGSGVGSSNDIPDKIPDGTTTKTEDPVDVESNKVIELHLSYEGKKVLQELELSKAFGENNNLFAGGTYPEVDIYPYWVGDGGITIGFGHFFASGDIKNKSQAKLIKEFKLENADFNETHPIKQGPKIVPNCDPVPGKRILQIFESDVNIHENPINNYLNEKNIVLTQYEFDALVIYRFKAGELSSGICKRLVLEASLDKSKQSSEEKEERKKAWKKLLHSGNRGDKEFSIFFHNENCYSTVSF